MHRQNTFFISGISTEVGKTVASAVLAEAWQADYWKPVQAGDLHYSDTMKVQQWIRNNHSQFHDEAFRLNHPMSPHAAAALDGIKINLDDFEVPETNNHLLIEGAGGLFVPLNDKHAIIDLIKKLGFPVILVSRHYLGSINHTLLSVLALKNMNISIHGILFNGKENKATENIIEKMSRIRILGRISEMGKPDQENICKEALKFR